MGKRRKPGDLENKASGVEDPKGKETEEQQVPILYNDNRGESLTNGRNIIFMFWDGG